MVFSTLSTILEITTVIMNEEIVWIFGYGSLIWRVDFPYLESQEAYITGWTRRFWQGSTDHRGVPGSPGRVVTLTEKNNSTCWGKAYRLHPENSSEILADLDHREKGGYDRLAIPLHFRDGRQALCITYHAVKDNPNYLGSIDTLSIARQILRSSGPSGHNVEYILNLETALADMSIRDAHVSEIADQIRELQMT